MVHGGMQSDNREVEVVVILEEVDDSSTNKNLSNLQFGKR